MIRFSLVIPCYNEAANLPLLIARCKEVFTRADVEVVLVDNGSTDDTAAVLDRLLGPEKRVRHIRVSPNQGYGHGILAGLAAAEGQILGWTHADMQTDPADALRALAVYEASDRPDRLFVKGRRSGRAPADVLFTVGMSVFESVLLRSRFWDINAQPTLVPRAFFQSWQSPPGDFSLDLFAYHAAHRAGLQILRIPVVFGKRAHGISRWNVNWSAKMRFIRRTVGFSLELRRRLKQQQRRRVG